jgi:chromosome segregation ATPase
MGMGMAFPNNEMADPSDDCPSRYAEAAGGPLPDANQADEEELLRLDNAELRQRVADLEQIVNEQSKAQETLAEQQADYEKCVEEKSEVIRTLHLKIQELQARPPGASPREEELLALSEELETERRQIKEDEAALMQQMSSMEFQMSRERAELARQRSELQRLQNEIHMELEMASREAALRDRLAPLQRRHHEIVQRNGAEPAREPVPATAVDSPPEQPLPKDSGLFRRLFRQGSR